MVCPWGLEELAFMGGQSRLGTGYSGPGFYILGYGADRESQKENSRVSRHEP